MGDKSKHRRGRKRSRKASSIARRKKQHGGTEIVNPEEHTQSSTSSASKQKILLTPEATSAVKNTGLVKERFILMDLRLLSNFFCQNMNCGECKQGGTLSCKIDLSSKMGFYHKLLINCSECLWSAVLDSSSSLESGSAG